MELKELENGIESLIKDINACVSDRDAMEAEQKKLKLEMANTIVNNYKTLFLPKVKELFSLTNTLYEKNVLVQERQDMLVKSGEASLIMHSNGGAHFFFYTYKDNLVSYGGFGRADDFLEKFEDGGWCVSKDENFYKMLYEFFGTEDKTLFTLEKYKELVIQVLQSMHNGISKANSELADKLDSLKTVINNSHTLEEKSDGSIEITLNGKTYIGTLKEA